jgi:hypothetical protein
MAFCGKILPQTEKYLYTGSRSGVASVLGFGSTVDMNGEVASNV